MKFQDKKDKIVLLKVQPNGGKLCYCNNPTDP